MAQPTRGVKDYLQNLVYRAVIGTALALPYRWRVAFSGWAVSVLAGPAGWRQRVRDNLALIMPDMPKPEVERLARKVPNHFGRTLIEIWSGAEFRDRFRNTPLTGSGFAALQEAKAQNRPIILITGHFGNYDVPRVALLEQGFRVGGLYNALENGYFNDRYVAAMNAIGEPVFERSRRGLAEMMRFLKSGGAIGLLTDHFMAHGEPIEFLGHPAWTATNAAEMAVKYDALVVPIYGVRRPDGINFDIVIDDPVPHGDPIEMTKAMNGSLERLVQAHPEQWFWIHRRWKRPPGV